MTLRNPEVYLLHVFLTYFFLVQFRQIYQNFLLQGGNEWLSETLRLGLRAFNHVYAIPDFVVARSVPPVISLLLFIDLSEDGSLAFFVRFFN